VERPKNGELRFPSGGCLAAPFEPDRLFLRLVESDLTTHKRLLFFGRRRLSFETFARYDIAAIDSRRRVVDLAMHFRALIRFFDGAVAVTVELDNQFSAASISLSNSMTVLRLLGGFRTCAPLLLDQAISRDVKFLAMWLALRSVVTFAVTFQFAPLAVRHFMGVVEIEPIDIDKILALGFVGHEPIVVTILVDGDTFPSPANTISGAADDKRRLLHCTA
jgi:hypothetical protein